jgi:hypothetical protein
MILFCPQCGNKDYFLARLKQPAKVASGEDWQIDINREDIYNWDLADLLNEAVRADSSFFENDVNCMKYGIKEMCGPRGIFCGKCNNPVKTVAHYCFFICKGKCKKCITEEA